MSSLSQKLEVANNLGSNNKYSDFKSNVGSSVNLTSTIYTSNKSTENIQITCSTSNSSIYYTLDETDPNETSNLYSSQFSVNTPSLIKARAFKEGWDPSDISSLSIELPRLPDPVFVKPINRETGEVSSHIGIQNWKDFPKNTSVIIELNGDRYNCSISSETYEPNTITYYLANLYIALPWINGLPFLFECQGYQSLIATLPELPTE